MADPVERALRVEVAWATPERQLLLALEVPPGTTALGALERSGLADRVPGLDPRTAALAVFGKVVGADRVLRDGDRVEVLRPLRADPKDVRRRLAAEGRTMGRARKPE